MYLKEPGSWKDRSQAGKVVVYQDDAIPIHSLVNGQHSVSLLACYSLLGVCDVRRIPLDRDYATLLGQNNELCAG